MELVPFGVATVTSTWPDAWAGLSAVTSVAVSVLMVARVAPKKTADAPLRPVPLIATIVPPALVPTVGETVVIVGVDPGTILAVTVCPV
jgi:hypothetical protein